MQTITFEGKGKLTIIRTFTSGTRQLHQTEDGFFYAPGQLLKTVAEAHAFVPKEHLEAALAFVNRPEVEEAPMAVEDPDAGMAQGNAEEPTHLTEHYGGGRGKRR